MKTKYFLISLIIIGIILNGFNIVVNAQNDDFGGEYVPDYYDIYNNYTKWTLYKDVCGCGEYKQITNQLTIKNNWDKNFTNVKTTLIFTPKDIAIYKLSFDILPDVNNYQTKNNKIDMNITIKEKFVYPIIFDYSDISQTTNHKINGGVFKNKYGFEVIIKYPKIGIPVVIDPFFGGGFSNIGTQVSDNLLGFNCTNNNLGHGTGQYIQANLKQTANTYAKCALYDKDKNLLAETEELFIRASGRWAWYTFDFVGTKPYIESGERYIIAIMGDTGGGQQIGSIFVFPSNFKTHKHIGIGYPASFPDPMTTTATTANQQISIKCFYKVDATLTIENMTNGTIYYNKYLDGINNSFFNLSADITHNQSLEMTANISLNGKWLTTIEGLTNGTLKINALDYTNEIDYTKKNNWTINLTDYDGNYINKTANFSFYKNNVLLTGVVLFDNYQFYFIMLLFVWLYFLWIAIKEKKFSYSVIQFVIQMPLFFIIVSDAWINNQPYGYVIGLAFFLVSLIQITYVYMRS